MYLFIYVFIYLFIEYDIYIYIYVLLPQKMAQKMEACRCTTSAESIFLRWVLSKQGFYWGCQPPFTFTLQRIHMAQP